MNHIKKIIKNAYPMIEERWDKSIIPTLCEYIKIPSKSVLFDKNWEANGYIAQAMQLIVNWCQENPLKDMKLTVLTEKGKTPLLLIEIPGQINDTVLLYGHMDKQPEMRGWDDNKGPWNPVLEKGKLYGRGAADDGYSTFAAMTAISILQENNIPHARCLILIEASEESGSVDLEYYLEQLKSQLGSPSLVICLDSGTGNYEQLWGTTSLRGLIGGTLCIEVLNKGIHSGLGSGVVPSTFSILETLLARIENAKTNEIILKKLHVKIPKKRLHQTKKTAKILKTTFLDSYNFAANTQFVEKNIFKLLLNRSWRPALSVTGIDGVPSIEDAGNVTLPKLTVKLSLRIPPTLPPHTAQQILKDTLEKSSPFKASIQYTPLEIASGWDAPAMEHWLKQANKEASMLFFNKPSAYLGEGGSIPFMSMLGQMFPKAQFMITGVLGPLSNAHGPNEFLHIEYVKKLTGCISYLLAAHGHAG